MNYVLSVTEINKYIKGIISKDIILSNLWIKGEISNYKYHYSGHMYFTIKDENSLLKCVMFKTSAAGLKFRPDNGLKVIIRGYVSVFERDGQYQLYAEEMQPDGIGNLHLAFEQLKMKLQEEGIFDPKHKKRIPYLPKSIGIITSRTGAVVKDILNIVSRRFPNVQVKILPVAVQGEQASLQIAKAVRKFNELKNVDVIIVARGGGSLEELWAFNEEVVARSIFASDIPVISAVGHETDFTICDFAADLRAPTPSAAAEMAVPEKVQLEDRLQRLGARLDNALRKNMELKRMKLDSLVKSTAFRQPYDRVYQARMRLDVLNKYMMKALESKLEQKRSRFQYAVGKLDVLSPLTVLSRGYSVVKFKNTHKVVKLKSDAKSGDKLEIVVSDGKIDCTVDECT